jgi:AcrR family transcriptional regulator
VNTGRVAVSRGVSREQWVLEALDVLNESGVDQVTIYNLARRLGIARSGFYWHFKNREELLEAMLDTSEDLLTKVVTENPQLMELKPVDRLVQVAEMVHDLNLSCYEVGLRHWAMQCETTARRLQEVVQTRTNFVKHAFAELGFESEALEMRAMIYIGYTAWEEATYSYVPRDKRRSLIRKRIELLTRKD